MSLIALPILYFLIATTAQSCLTSSEEYAVEVVVPNYNIDSLGTFAERESQTYSYPSTYSSQALTLIKETEFPKGLSIRIQLPTIIKEIKEPHLKFISYSASGSTHTMSSSTFNGWRIQCTTIECTLEKDLTKITVPVNNRVDELTFETTQDLLACSEKCSGTCFTVTKTSKCLSSTFKQDIDSILRYTNISQNFNELLKSYRIVGSEDIVIADILPNSTTSIDWQEATRQELVFLSNKGIIKIARGDIETIAERAKRGQAGVNYRMVYDEEMHIWRYYNEIPGAALTTDRDCSSYSLPKTIKSSPEPPLGTFYLIPLIITIAIVLALVILIIIARLTSPTRRTHKRKI